MLPESGIAFDNAEWYNGGMNITKKLCAALAASLVFNVNAKVVKTIAPVGPRSVRVRVADSSNMGKSELILRDYVFGRFAKPYGGECEISWKADGPEGLLSFSGKDGKVFLRELERELPSGGKLGRASVDFDSPEDEELYGLGQFQDRQWNVRGIPRRLIQVNSQASTPFWHSTRGYSILWNNMSMTEWNPCRDEIPLSVRGEGKSVVAEISTGAGGGKDERKDVMLDGEFRCAADGEYMFSLEVCTPGNSMASIYDVEIDGEKVVNVRNLWLPPHYGFKRRLSAGSHKVSVVCEKKNKVSLRYEKVDGRTKVVSDVTRGIDYVVIVGNPVERVAEMRRLTGGTAKLPDYAYGFWQCRERYHSQAELLENLREFKKRGIPLDVIVQDWQWWTDGTWNSMEWDKGRFPDPKAMTDEIHAAGVKMMLSVWSKASRGTKFGQEISAVNGFIGDTEWIDFFNNKASVTYWDWFVRNLVGAGVDSWWLDAVEPENDALHGQKIAIGDGDAYRNIFPLAVNQTATVRLKLAGQSEPLILTRCWFLGQNRLPTVIWSGDVGSEWSDLRAQVLAGLGAMASGVPYWTSDGGGFFRPYDQYTNKDYHKRLVRWMQFETFSPVMRIHGFVSNTEPWRYGPEVERILRKYIELRYTLKKEIVAAGEKTARENWTMMRPLFMDFPDDAKARAASTEYMFLEDLLVAPVTEDAEKALVYLPEGKWKNFWTGEIVEGSREVEVAAPLDIIPVFRRVK